MMQQSAKQSQLEIGISMSPILQLGCRKWGGEDISLNSNVVVAPHFVLLPSTL